MVFHRKNYSIGSDFDQSKRSDTAGVALFFMAGAEDFFEFGRGRVARRFAGIFRCVYHVIITHWAQVANVDFLAFLCYIPGMNTMKNASVLRRN